MFLLLPSACEGKPHHPPGWLLDCRPATCTKNTQPTPALRCCSAPWSPTVNGLVKGRLKDVAVATGPAAGNVAGLLLKTREGRPAGGGQRTCCKPPPAPSNCARMPCLQPLRDDENLLLLQQDVLDRQIIDVHGRKVVRVNDIDLQWYPAERARRVCGSPKWPSASAERSAELFKGLMPRQTLNSISPGTFPTQRDSLGVCRPDRSRSGAPGEAQDRACERLAHMHPSDLADILEDLLAAGTRCTFLSRSMKRSQPMHWRKWTRWLQKSLLESLDSGRVADIVEEMDPGAAADLLAELSDERSEAILDEDGPGRTARDGGSAGVPRKLRCRQNDYGLRAGRTPAPL